MTLHPESHTLTTANNSASAPTTQPTYSTELELANAHLGLTYVALGDIVKQHPKLITTIHPVLLLELVELGHLSISTCHQVLLSNHLRNATIIPAGGLLDFTLLSLTTISGILIECHHSLMKCNVHKGNLR
jgi:hypothetical protein